MSAYEYGILWGKYSPVEPHRSGMTEEEAREWIAECEEMGFKPGMFTLIRRPLGEWEHVDG